MRSISKTPHELLMMWTLLLVAFLLPGKVHAQGTAMTVERTTILMDGGYNLPETVSAVSDTLLQSYLHLAYEQSDALKSSFEGYMASLTRKDQVSVLPNPEIMFQYYLNPESFGGVFDQATIGIMQMFPWAGTRKEARNYENLLSLARWQQVENTKLELLANVKESWYALVYIHRSRAYLEEHLQWINQLESLTRSRAESGLASRADLIRLEIERSEVKSSIEAIEVRYKGQLARMNSFLKRPATEPVQLPDGRPELEWHRSYQQTLEPVLRMNPEAISSMILIEASETMERRARLEGYPMIGIGLEFMGPNSTMRMESGRVPIFGRVAISVPIWRARYRALKTQAEAETRMSVHDREEVRRQLTSEVSMALAEYDEANIKVNLYRNSMLPLSRELTDLLLLDYSNARSGLEEVIEARRRSVEIATNLEEAIFERNLAVIRLERLGFDLIEYSN